MESTRTDCEGETGVCAPERVTEQTSSAQGSLSILIVTAPFWPFSGGVQTYVDLLATGLARRGHLITVATTSRAENFDDNQLSFRVARRPNLLQLWRLIGNTQVLQLAGPTFLPLLLGLMRRKPIVIEHHGYQAICPNGLLLHQPDQTACPGHFMDGAHEKCLSCLTATEGHLPAFWKWLSTFPRYWMCRRVAMNAPITQHVLNRLRLPQSRVIYYGIPEAPVDKQCLASIASRTVCFAYVGRLVGEKGLPLLLEAAAQLHYKKCDFRLKFVGDGPERSRLEQMAAAKGLSGKVTFTGFLRGVALRQATQDVAAVVMPSIWEETAGLAAMEQMMRGRLVIAADIGGLGEVVDGTSLKFTAGNVGQLAACMKQVIDNPEIVSRIGAEARRRCLSMFHEDQMVENHLSAYFQLLQMKSESPSGCGRPMNE